MTLKDYLGREGIKVTDFAEKLGIAPQSLYRYLAQERFPRQEILAKIAAHTAGAVTPNDFFAGSV